MVLHLHIVWASLGDVQICGWVAGMLVRMVSTPQNKEGVASFASMCHVEFVVRKKQVGLWWSCASPLCNQRAYFTDFAWLDARSRKPSFNVISWFYWLSLSLSLWLYFLKRDSTYLLMHIYFPFLINFLHWFGYLLRKRNSKWKAFARFCRGVGLSFHGSVSRKLPSHQGWLSFFGVRFSRKSWLLTSYIRGMLSLWNGASCVNVV